MNALMMVHVAAGIAALGSGTLAVTVRKGGAVHALTGTWFFASMLVLGATASLLEPLRDPPGSPIGGLIVCYFVATAWLAARRRSGIPSRFEKIACAAILAIALAVIGKGIQMAMSGVPPSAPPGPGALLMLGGFCLAAGLGDLRFILRGNLTPKQRIARHLWRMLFALFIATGSFFLGQQQVLPQAMRGSPVLLVLAFAPFLLMLFWLVRVRFFGVPRRAAPLVGAQAP